MCEFSDFAGGVIGMDDFLKKFFPTVLRRKNAYTSSDGDHCKYDNHVLELFTSSLYLAALAASWIAAVITRKYGRISSIKIGGLSFLIGPIMNSLAVNFDHVNPGQNPARYRCWLRESGRLVFVVFVNN